MFEFTVSSKYSTVSFPGIAEKLPSDALLSDSSQFSECVCQLPANSLMLAILFSFSASIQRSLALDDLPQPPRRPSNLPPLDMNWNPFKKLWDGMTRAFQKIGEGISKAFRKVGEWIVNTVAPETTQIKEQPPVITTQNVSTHDGAFYGRTLDELASDISVAFSVNSEEVSQHLQLLRFDTSAKQDFCTFSMTISPDNVNQRYGKYVRLRLIFQTLKDGTFAVTVYHVTNEASITATLVETSQRRLFGWIPLKQDKQVEFRGLTAAELTSLYDTMMVKTREQFEKLEKLYE